MVNEAVRGLLAGEVEEAKRAHKAAKEACRNVADQPLELPRIPTGLPDPDGSAPIRDAAILRLNRF